MQIQLNGEPSQLPRAMNLAELMEHLQLQGRRVAVELNQQIVPKSRHQQTLIQPGDQIEIVHAIGGG